MGSLNGGSYKYLLQIAQTAEQLAIAHFSIDRDGGNTLPDDDLSLHFEAKWQG